MLCSWPMCLFVKLTGVYWGSWVFFSIEHKPRHISEERISIVELPYLTLNYMQVCRAFLKMNDWYGETHLTKDGTITENIVLCYSVLESNLTRLMMKSKSISIITPFPLLQFCLNLPALSFCLSFSWYCTITLTNKSFFHKKKKKILC